MLIPLVPVFALAGEPKPKSQTYWAYIGTYTRGSDSKGIYRFEFDPTTGKLSNRILAGETVNPSFLALHPNHKFLYSVGEIANFEGKKSGAIAAFAIDQKTGKLNALNQQPSGGGGPCHVVVDKQGKNVLAANYGGGSACVLPINKDGGLGKMTGFVQHEGSSVNPRRQKGPHAHSINLDPANNFAFVADLGLDKVLVYRFDPKKGTLTANKPASVKVAPGAGPRHFAFHPKGKYAYVINELANTITALSYNPETGELSPIQTITTLPKGFQETSHTAEVVVHPSGKFVYGSNRGHDSIAIFKVNRKTGKLRSVGIQGENIKTPRNFVVDPTGNFLIVANQAGDSLVVFRIDQKTGDLQPTGIMAEVPRPVCVRFMPKPAN